MFINLKKEKSQALIVVVTLLAVFSVMGIAFYSLSQVERRTSERQLNIIRAHYLAEAAVAYGQKVLYLDREENLIDSLEDLPFKCFQGEELDLDGDGTNESRWFEVMDSEGSSFGRFSMRVLDEASKININTCREGTLNNLFSQKGIDQGKAGSLIGARPLNAIEQAGAILGKEGFRSAKDFMTIYSQDKEIDLTRQRRRYLNSCNPQVLLEIFFSLGVKNAHQKAALLKDAQDTDLTQTILDKFYLGNLSPSSLMEQGDWKKVGNYYEAPAGGREGKFSWSNLAVEDGEYFCFLYGPQSSDIIGEFESRDLVSGEGLANMIKVENGSIRLGITPSKNSISRFSYLELISAHPRSGLNRRVVTGTEAVVINELMIKLIQEFTVDLPALQPGQSLEHTFSGITKGNYYLIVLAKEEGGLVGDVSVEAKSKANLYDGDYFPYIIEVGSDGLLNIEIKNNSLSEVATFGGIKISQQPDGEFIELLNLSSQDIDLSNFSFETYSSEGELIAGWPGLIPEGTKIRSFQHLVFAIDNTDTTPSPTKLRSNKISFKDIWGLTGVGLIFEDYATSIDKGFDLLPDKGGSIILKNSEGKRIDAIEYQNFQVGDFVSLERPDPTANIDSDGDGLFDGWYSSEDDNGATPNLTNENIGMYTGSGITLIKHTPSEIKFFNRPLLNLNEILQLSSGENWNKFILSDLARICDSISYEAMVLDLKNNYLSGEFEEKDLGFESQHKQDSGIWQFDNIPVTTYALSLESIDSEGCEILVAYKQNPDEDFDNFSSLMFSDGFAYFGEIELEGEQECSFQLKVINNSEKVLLLKGVFLEPIAYKSGRVNINTASPEVLRSIFASEDLVQKILANRPMGNKDNSKLGVGELLILDPAFLGSENLVTVKSDIYELSAYGEYLLKDKPVSSQSIRTVVERGE